MTKKLLFLITALTFISFAGTSQTGAALSFSPNATTEAPDYNFGTGNLTIEAWVKPNNLNGAYLISNRGSQFFGNGAWYVIHIAGDISVEMGSSNGSYLTFGTATTVIAPNVWQHIAWVRASTGHTIYVNGIVKATVTDGVVRNFTSGQNVFDIGSWPQVGTAYYNGAVDEVRLWNTARTQAQIVNNMMCELVSPTTITGLVRYYKFNQGIGGGTNTGVTTLTDASASGVNGTLYNFALTGTASNWILDHPQGVQAPNYSVCIGNSVTIVPTGADTYTITGGTFTVSPAVNTTYTIDATGIAGCTSSTQLVVNVNSLPVISANSATICSGQSATIVPSGASTYSITGGTFTVSPLTNTSYSVTGTSTAGCVSAAPAVSTVSVNTTPTVGINSATICSGSSVTLTPAGAASYTITGNTFTVTPNSTTSYSLTGSTNGCLSNTVVSTVSVNTTPTVSINSATICSGNSVTLAPTGASSYTITGKLFYSNTERNNKLQLNREYKWLFIQYSGFHGFCKHNANSEH